MSGRRMLLLTPAALFLSTKTSVWNSSHSDAFLIAMVLADIQSLSLGGYWITVSISPICYPGSVGEIS